MTDTKFDPLLAPSSFSIDNDELFSSSSSMSVPSVDDSSCARQMMGSHGSVTSSWSPHDVPSGSAGSAYPTGTSNTRPQSVANPTSTALQDHSVLGQDFLTFPEGLNEIVDFGAFQVDQCSPFFSFATQKTPATDSGTTNPDNLLALDVGDSSSEASSLLYNLSCARPQLGTESGCRQAPPREMETTCMNSRQACLSSALETLQGLHIPLKACLCSINETDALVNRSQPRKTDSVLATNRTAVRRLSEILHCSCKTSSQVQLVLIIICDKLMAWYRACSNADTQNLDYHNNLDAVNSMASERVLHQRFGVGEYSFDTNLESKIRAQVIGSELQQLESVIANLADSLQKENLRGVDPIPESEGSQSTLTIDSPGLSSAVYARLTTYLHKQLQDIKADIARVK